MSIASAARRLADLLRQTGHRIVFAESCTGGLVSGALTAIHGISEFHCGCMVTYRNETKARWLGISRKFLEQPGPVSAEVAAQMASEVLARTPEATIAVSVTGHLGPGAPPALDGLVFIAAEICHDAQRASPYQSSVVANLQLAPQSRLARQKIVVQTVLEFAAQLIASPPYA